MRIISSPFVCAVLSAVATSALAGNGVLEINQACAVNTGCFAGDGPGYPVVIDGSRGRSYRLTSDLVVPDENTDGIRIETTNLSIDLGGFEIVRAGCEGATSACTPSSGVGHGVVGYGADKRAISLRNGTITGMGLHGVSLGAEAQVRHVRVRWNRVDGIVADVWSTVSGCTAHANGQDGIEVKAASLVKTSVSTHNGAVGIRTGDATTVVGSTSTNNQEDGIEVGKGSTVSGSTAAVNQAFGIAAELGGVTISGNTVWLNASHGVNAGEACTITGNTAFSNGGSGIVAGAGSQVQSNSARSNTGVGLDLSATAAYRENTITGNAGTVTGGVDLGDNYCDGAMAPSCP